MITTIAELLDTFRRKEAELLNERNIKHAPTIGAMYEGLTRDVLSRSIPKDLNLRVVSGFITNSEGKTSNQIDCMLVSGEGERIPYTDNFTYHVKNVIAVIEVKKNLYSSALSEAYANLVSVKTLRDQEALRYHLFDDAYRLIVQNLPPALDQVKSLPVWKQQIFYTLADESMLPVRVVLGYRGFANEWSFRKAFMDYLDANMGKDDSGPISLPNLIICNNYSLVKFNGMPYAASLRNEYWPIYASFSENPMIPFLELIWTRLTYDEMLDTSVFGEDLVFEQPKLLLSAKAIEQDGKVGWIYRATAVSRELLESTPKQQTWEPAYLTDYEAMVLGTVIAKEEVDINDPVLESNLQEVGLSMKTIIEALLETGLVSVENDKLTLLTRECRLIRLPDESWVAAEDASGRFTNWFHKFMNEYKLDSD